MDWSAGRYEHIAAGLEPAAQEVVSHARLRAGELVVDVGCGTGNAALLAARAGARVIGVDPAPRLLEVAAARAAALGLDVRFLRGAAAALPLGDGEADCVLSVFVVNFAPDPAGVIAELTRVTAPDGRIVLSAWTPGGPIGAVGRMRREALEPPGSPPAPAPFAWHEQDALAKAFGAHGLEVTMSTHALPFVAGSAREFLESELRDHPLWVSGRPVLERSGRTAEVHARALAIFEDANEDPRAFRVTSSYVIAVARRSADATR